ncbi:MAG: carbohydrate ABC transporter permease [bacterium]
MKRILIVILLCLISILTLTPLLWMFTASIMPAGSTSTYPPRLLPQQITWEHYLVLFTRLNLGKYLLNSILISLGVTLISLIVNSMAGYAFAKYRFAGRDKLFRFLLASMIVPGQVTMLPLFLMLNKLGFVNTYWGILIPGMASIFGIFMIRQYALSIPDSLIEAARIDGAGDFQIYLTIVLPLFRPILATLGLFTFIGTWNDFLWPLIVMTDDSMYTMPVAIGNLIGEHVPDTELMMAGSVLTVLPILIVFAALQKFYIRGIMAGSVKG